MVDRMQGLFEYNDPKQWRRQTMQERYQRMENLFILHACIKNIWTELDQFVQHLYERKEQGSLPCRAIIREANVGKSHLIQVWLQHTKTQRLASEEQTLFHFSSLSVHTSKARSKASKRRSDMTTGTVPSRKLQRMVRYTSLLFYLYTIFSSSLMEEAMPVRTISNWGGNIIGAIPSRKLKRMVHYESLIERAYIYLLEHDPQVPLYEEQPYNICYLFEGKEHRYTPDFYVTRSQGKALLVECKPEALIHDSMQKVKWTAARLWCERNNMIFTVVTDSALQRQSALLSNLQLLAIHAHQPIPPQAREYMLSIFAILENPFTVMDVVQRASRLNEYHVKSYLWQWLYFGELETNLFVPLQFRTTALFWKGTNY